MRKRHSSEDITNKAKNIIDKSQLPTGAFINTPHFEMNSNKEVIIEGSSGVLEYDENLIRIKTGKFISQFIGRNLNIKCLTEDSLVIDGFITSIEFVV